MLEGSLRQRLTGRYSEPLAQVRMVVIEDGALQGNKPSKHINRIESTQENEKLRQS